jgi:nucleotide-binding universal stress UspA family protein
MLPFRKIVFPVDYSESCKQAVPYVEEMARRFSAEVSLVHAYGAEALAFSDLALTNPDLPEQAHAAEVEELERFGAEMFPGRHVERRAQLGEPGVVIENYIQHQGADLVMLPTHGRGVARRLLLGSVTAKVLHDSSIPVWTATSGVLSEKPPRIPYTSILCSLDQSEESEAVARAAAALACKYGARLNLLHVVETPPTSLEMDFMPYRKELVEAAEVTLRELKGTLGIEAPHRVVDGFVFDAIHNEAIRTEADLIVTGRGRVQGVLTRPWSHLYAIVRAAPCPVLSI